MIKENQKLLNQLNVLSDGVILFFMLPLAFWLRFFVLPGGEISVPLREYLVLDIFLTFASLFTIAAFGLYHSFRRERLRKELARLWMACALDIGLLLSYLFVAHDVHYSRLTLALYFVLSLVALSGKRIVLRKTLRHFRKLGYNRKYVLILGNGPMAHKYLKAILAEPEFGFYAVGYVSETPSENEWDLAHLGRFEHLEQLIECHHPDEVVSAVEVEDYHRMREIIIACEKTGTKLSVIPLYADFMPPNPQFDELNGIPLMNIRRIPLDNWANAFLKRAVDIVGSFLLLLISSPVMLACAIGVKLSSPGPVFFKQERVGLGKKSFYMYKFRSMRVNDSANTAWSEDYDERKTKFGAFLRKCSLDEFPQFFNVLKGDMSLVGPRPEIPFFVDQFKEEVPLYMVKHQVRPGITGWAQVNGFRGDTSIKGRIEHDIYYIEHWSLLFDLKILLITLFGGKFLNNEKLS